MELKGFDLDRTYELSLPLEDNTGSIQLLLAITGTESQCAVSTNTSWSDTVNSYVSTVSKCLILHNCYVVVYVYAVNLNYTIESLV